MIGGMAIAQIFCLVVFIAFSSFLQFFFRFPWFPAPTWILRRLGVNAPSQSPLITKLTTRIAEEALAISIKLHGYSAEWHENWDVSHQFDEAGRARTRIDIASGGGHFIGV